MSADPIWEKYLGTSPKDLVNDGMFDTVHMNLYSYVRQNPINMLDPTGESEEDVEAILQDISTRYEGEITPPKFDDIIFSKMDPKIGGSTSLLGTVKLPKDMLKDSLSMEEFVDAYDAILHESIHKSDSIINRFKDRGDEGASTENHESIYNRVRYELGERVDYDRDKTTSRENFVAKPVWGVAPENVKLDTDARNPDNILHEVKDLYENSRN